MDAARGFVADRGRGVERSGAAGPRLAAVALGAELPDVASVLIDLQALDSAAVAGCRAVYLVAVGIVPAVPIAGALSSGADAGRVGGVAGNSAHFPDVGAGGVGARAVELPDVATVRRVDRGGGAGGPRIRRRSIPRPVQEATV